MSLPETVRVKLSSEAADSLSVTPVVARDMPVRELVEMMLGVTGKRFARIHDLLLRGSFVSGASRLRWAGWDADPAALEALLATFPDPEPDRPFARQLCKRAVLKGPGTRIEIAREVGQERRLLRRGSFWEVVMELAAGGGPQYIEYSYKERADCYSMLLGPADAARCRQSAGLIRYSTLEAQVRRSVLDSLDLYVARED